MKTSEVADFAEVPLRTIQFWADRHVLEVDNGGDGRGSHRQFDAVEAKVARALSKLSFVTVSKLRKIAETIRPQVCSGIVRLRYVEEQFSITINLDDPISGEIGQPFCNIDEAHLRHEAMVAKINEERMNLTAIDRG